ncbi:1,6-dihydroxycyclohexa-2,4-diene-1-carboxylate dehydrogenase [Sphingopyxis bauzanensis]|uniref:1,6-dihydroxycyclohexa-2,4-diene-1-carboxylate dehydrogenase n=1 Tax=Sphingopyxis bauzanensis TaxID=651663 RepID=A0A246JJR8_9SPHN|nr:1,6-dihydroxycyclohexa-2,4-diene-1-carboxylate dehydrogenase [Sphingopyxis bauzanensis]OWQ92753.1 1,6-dihydroxycyclohexa-2,4-diene-1-carboxylate dehydrogenase [Sphingopyxis bauzanensis]GGJ57001.1 1,6-dihydroxycyclohexa-2,4-diene-1-carboxylate dehydrogenase [Sphingopyxis bauzanensis]
MTFAKRFDNQIAVVTGGAQGIGLATARRMAEEGAIVIIADRAADATQATVDRLRDNGCDVHAAIFDLEKCEGATELYRTVTDQFGQIDVAVHNVGGTIWAKPYWDYKPDEIVAEINRSLWPTLWCCHAVVPYMLAAGRGSIVNIGSVATRGVNRVPYAAAKGGVAALTAALSLELETSGVRINCVAPGGVNVTRVTPRDPAPMSDVVKAGFAGVMEQTLRDTPMARFGEPDELAAAICFFASQEASYVTGQTLFVAGGGIG